MVRMRSRVRFPTVAPLYSKRMPTIFAYRPSVAALIFDQKRRFLLVQLNNARTDEFDFVKGGMNHGEKKEEALKREIQEELGSEFRYKIIEQSHWYLVYDWDKDLQEKKGYIGQARTSFWTKYISGNIGLNSNELKTHKWIEEKDLKQELLKSGFPNTVVTNLLNEWNEKKDKML